MGTSNNWGNDFIQAYLGGVRTRLEREKQAFEQKQQLDQAPLQKMLLQKQIEHIDQLNAEAQAHAGYQAEQLKSAIRGEFLSGQRVAPPALQNPQMPGQQNVNLSPVNYVNQQPQEMNTSQEPSYQGPSAPSDFQSVPVDPRLGTGGVLNIDNVPTPDQQDQRTLKNALITAKTAGLKAGAEAEAKAPTQIKIDEAKVNAQTEGNLKVAGVNNASKENIAATEIKSKEQIAADNNARALKVASGNNNATIQAAGIRAAATKYATDHKTSTALDPTVISDNAILAATGHAPVPGYTNTGMAIKSVMKQQNLVPFDPKDAEKLKAVNDVNVLYQYMQDEIGKLPDNQIGAFGQRMASKVPGTDVNNVYQSVFGRAANISHTYGGEIGRLSDPDVQRAMGLLVTPGITKQQAVARLQQMQLETSSKVLDHLLGGQKPHQQLMNLEEYQMNPEKFVVRYKNNNIPKFIKDGDSWRSLNLRTGTYDMVN